MAVSVAIPVPSTDPEYNQRALKPYLDALSASGMTPFVVALDQPQDQVARQLVHTQAALLPGSRFDIDPQRYGETPIPECGEADPARTAVDELLLQDAFNLHKPVLAICHGTQSLNV
ncbi:MAG TPA: gamma-glutamyl-gamma-aminobutyrate hydrolase family protein, partial [Terracidiphilus sp.]